MYKTLSFIYLFILFYSILFIDLRVPQKTYQPPKVCTCKWFVVEKSDYVMKEMMLPANAYIFFKIKAPTTPGFEPWHSEKALHQQRNTTNNMSRLYIYRFACAPKTHYTPKVYSCKWFMVAKSGYVNKIDPFFANAYMVFQNKSTNNSQFYNMTGTVGKCASFLPLYLTQRESSHIRLLSFEDIFKTICHSDSNTN